MSRCHSQTLHPLPHLSPPSHPLIPDEQHHSYVVQRPFSLLLHCSSPSPYHSSVSHTSDLAFRVCTGCGSVDWVYHRGPHSSSLTQSQTLCPQGPTQMVRGCVRQTVSFAPSESRGCAGKSRQST